MARPDLLAQLKKQLRQTLEMGAELTYGNKQELYAEQALSKGNFIHPMIFENVPKAAPGLREEIFGPAFMMVKFRSEKEAISLANETEYGLGYFY